jgi:phosphoribosylglycinamide formyltransferase-1
MALIKLAVLASGRGSNLQAIIDEIKNGRLSAEIKAVISDCPNAQALERAQSENIPALFLNPKVHSSRRDYDLALAEKVIIIRNQGS